MKAGRPSRGVAGSASGINSLSAWKWPESECLLVFPLFPAARLDAVTAPVLAAGQARPASMERPCEEGTATLCHSASRICRSISVAVPDQSIPPDMPPSAQTCQLPFLARSKAMADGPIWHDSGTIVALSLVPGQLNIFSSTSCVKGNAGKQKDACRTAFSPTRRTKKPARPRL